jgi:hypothetical protein
MKKFVLSILTISLLNVAIGNNFSTSANQQVAQPSDINLRSFQGYLDNNKVTVNWTVISNENVQQFELERSSNGVEFTNAALVFNTERNGTENYQFAQPMNGDRVYYRLKMTDKSQVVTYSKVLVFKTTTFTNFDLRVLNSTVSDKLTFSVDSPVTGPVSVRVLDLAGSQLMVQKLNIYKGTNTMSISMPSLKSGIYLIDLFDGNNHNTAKFIK